MNTLTIILAGIPASGKSTIFKDIRRILFQDSIEFEHKKVKGIKTINGEYQMLGVFDNSRHEGTDRLSMTVIGDAIEYINSINKGFKKVVFIEGDRLLNDRFIKETKAEIYIIEASPITILKRHTLRGDNQSETFLKSRDTKISNIIKKYNLKPYKNNNTSDKEHIVEMLVTRAKKWLNS